MPSVSMYRLYLAALALLLALTPAHAQDVGAAPTYGDVSLTEGFQPDPHTTRLTAGGSIEVDKGSCSYGYVADAPDVDLYYSTSGGSPLYIYAESEGDVTLLVNIPDVSWVCDDDGLGGTNPLLIIPNAEDGLYNIWIGTYGDAMQPATLYISEIDPRNGSANGGDLDVGAAPTYGDVRVSQGFASVPGVGTISTPDSGDSCGEGETCFENPFGTSEERAEAIRTGRPVVREVIAGGPVEVNEGSCTYGRAAGAPDVDLYFDTDGTTPLYLYARSDGDVTLVVNLPDGSWVCDDDSFGDSDPILGIPNAPDGLYNIWVGTYGTEMRAATLFIGEADPR